MTTARKNFIATLATNIVLKVLPGMIAIICLITGFYYNTKTSLIAHATVIDKSVLDIEKLKDNQQEYRIDQKVTRNDIGYMKEGMKGMKKSLHNIEKFMGSLKGIDTSSIYN